MLDRLEVLEVRVREMRAILDQVVESLREIGEAKAGKLVGEIEAPPDPRRK